MLQLRSFIDPFACWTDVGLKSLDDNQLPFPAETLTNCFPFPKISGRGKVDWTEDDLNAFMSAAHTGNQPDGLSTAFPASALPSLYRLMQPGQYYVPLPLSGSGDLLVWCGEQTVVCFQFKNYAQPITEAAVVCEAVKCVATGWVVYLVVVCLSGNGRDTDYVTNSSGIAVVVLCSSSVEAFMGRNVVQHFGSKTSLADQAVRIGYSPSRVVAGMETITAQLGTASFV